MNGETEITIIPKIRRVYSDTKANLDALTGLKDEELAYGTDTKLLYRQDGAGAANWVAVTTAGTRAFWLQPISGSGAVEGALGYFRGFDMDAAAEYVLFGARIPDDFTSIIEAIAVFIAKTTATHRINFQTQYGASGEAYDTHAESSLDHDVVCTANTIYIQSFAAALSSLAAEDYLAVKVLGDVVNVLDIQLIGLYFKYV